MSDFWCPNCLRHFRKDESITMLTSGAAISGEGINWSGDLERDIHNIKRVKYCGECHGALDFHALLRGKLDYRAYGLTAGFWTFVVLIPVLWLGAGLPLWASLLLAFIAALFMGWFFNRLEQRRISRWALSPEEAQRMSEQK